MQWLGGGWSAPYHELFLPALILGSAGLPLRRFVPFDVPRTDVITLGIGDLDDFERIMTAMATSPATPA